MHLDLLQIDTEGFDFEIIKMINFDKIKPSIHIPIKNPIPSDSRFREDLLWVNYKNNTFADKWKVLLEERQRYEKKLRIEGRNNITK